VTVLKESNDLTGCKTQARYLTHFDLRSEVKKNPVSQLHSERVDENEEEEEDEDEQLPAARPVTQQRPSSLSSSRRRSTHEHGGNMVYSLMSGHFFDSVYTIQVSTYANYLNSNADADANANLPMNNI
jgi:hypothetical protein